MAVLGLKMLRRLGKKLSLSAGCGGGRRRRQQSQYRPNNKPLQAPITISSPIPPPLINTVKTPSPVPSVYNKNFSARTSPSPSGNSSTKSNSMSSSNTSDTYASVTPLRRGGTLLRRNKSMLVRRAAAERINAWYEQLVEQYPHSNEWKIPYDELMLAHGGNGSALVPLRRNQHGTLYRGKWHGNVVVYKHENLTNVDFFLGLVQLLDRLRHDGLALYLGACIDAPDKLAIVFDATSVITLDDLISNKITMPRDRSYPALWQQSLHLAEAMEYLHCKGVVMGSNLAASNVLIDANGRAKLSLLDFGSLCSCIGRNGQPTHRTTTVFARLPPEVLSSVCQSHDEYMRHAWSRGADVYAFGCLLYEIFTGEQLMYSPTSIIGQSMIEMTPNSIMPRSIRQIVLACCAQDPAHRPTFELIVGALLNAQPPARLCAQQPPPALTSSFNNSSSTSSAMAMTFVRCTSVPNLADSNPMLSSNNNNNRVEMYERPYKLYPMSQSMPTSPRSPVAPPPRTTPYQGSMSARRKGCGKKVFLEEWSLTRGRLAERIVSSNSFCTQKSYSALSLNSVRYANEHPQPA